MIRYKSIYSILILLLIGCSSSSQTDKHGANPSRHTEGSDEDLSPISPEITYATDWTEVTIHANMAKTIVGTAAHFKTDRNACGRESYGALTLEDWNDLAAGVNEAISKPPAREWYCIQTPEDNSKYMDDSVEVNLENKKRILFEVKDGKICSTIQDHQISNTLLKAITHIIQTADKEDCPNGWGS